MGQRKREKVGVKIKIREGETRERKERGGGQERG
jgi:hypothetical protein